MHYCPVCGSDQTQSFPSIRESQSYSGGATTIGATYVGGQGAPFSGYTSHAGMSDLARRMAPPVPEQVGVWRWVFFWVAILIVVYATTLGTPFRFINSFGWLIASLVVWVAYTQRKRLVESRNATIFEPNFQAWQKSFHCYHCGHDFITA